MKKLTPILILVVVLGSAFALFSAGDNSSSGNTDQAPASNSASQGGDLVEQHLRTANRQGTVDATDQTQVNVEINDFFYDATVLTVKKGTTITWTNQGNVRHDVMLANNSPKSFESSELLANGQSYTVTLDETGTYLYFCSPHPTQMRAVIEVVE